MVVNPVWLVNCIIVAVVGVIMVEFDVLALLGAVVKAAIVVLL